MMAKRICSTLLLCTPIEKLNCKCERGWKADYWWWSFLISNKYKWCVKKGKRRIYRKKIKYRKVQGTVQVPQSELGPIQSSWQKTPHLVHMTMALSWQLQLVTPLFLLPVGAIVLLCLEVSLLLSPVAVAEVDSKWLIGSCGVEQFFPLPGTWAFIDMPMFTFKFVWLNGGGWGVATENEGTVNELDGTVSDVVCCCCCCWDKTLGQDWRGRNWFCY